MLFKSSLQASSRRVKVIVCVMCDVISAGEQFWTQCRYQHVCSCLGQTVRTKTHIHPSVERCESFSQNEDELKLPWKKSTRFSTELCTLQYSTVACVVHYNIKSKRGISQGKALKPLNRTALLIHSLWGYITFLTCLLLILYVFLLKLLVLMTDDCTLICVGDCSWPEPWLKDVISWIKAWMMVCTWVAISGGFFVYLFVLFSLCVRIPL